MENQNDKTAKRVFNLIIVDESGSMSIIHHEALAGINETINTCQQMQKKYPEMEQHITLISFDSNHFKMHYDNALATNANPLTMRDYQPSGATPLYDAIGKGVAKLNAQAGIDDNVLVTIITDGEENCSREYDLAMVKNLIEKQKKLGWTFTLIGTDNLDVEGMAKAFSIDNHLEFCEDEENTRKMFEKERKARSRYNDFCACEMPMPCGSFFMKED
ncbi:MAG: VWA domain-containing protein [Bacteroidaceae bacterium]|nr:VWA domain-containing protein [Bacteroidaceae bacterium]